MNCDVIFDASVGSCVDEDVEADVHRIGWFFLKLSSIGCCSGFLCTMQLLMRGVPSSPLVMVMVALPVRGGVVGGEEVVLLQVV